MTAAIAAPATAPPRAPRSVMVRVFLACWVIYCAHFSPFVVRELYLAMSLAERATPRVDPYYDLHADLFPIEGRGWYMGGNPGASLLAAVPYALLQPVVQRLAPIRPVPPGEKVSAQYEEERANKLLFYRMARERGLDLRLGVAAMVAMVFCMAPLSALSAVVMFRLMEQMGFALRPALWMTFLYALGTPVFFRTGTLSLNLVVALCGLFAFAALWWPVGTRPQNEILRTVTCGFFAGFAVLTDFTGAITASVLGLWALARQMETRRFWPAALSSLWFLAGAALPVGFLFYWQWLCYGNPWLPAQFHMPQIIYTGYAGQHGFGAPQPAALWALLFDPLFGLLIFAPILAVALYHFALVKRGTNGVPGRVAWLAWAYFAALWVFCSCIHYTLRHQWQDGIRYMVPVVPLLFLLVADVLRQAKPWITALLGTAALVETFCLSMVRESPWESLQRVFTGGIEFPWLTALARTAAQYAPAVADHTTAIAWGAAGFTALLVRVIWRAGRRGPLEHPGGV